MNPCPHVSLTNHLASSYPRQLTGITTRTTSRYYILYSSATHFFPPRNHIGVQSWAFSSSYRLATSRDSWVGREMFSFSLSFPANPQDHLCYGSLCLIMNLWLKFNSSRVACNATTRKDTHAQTRMQKMTFQYWFPPQAREMKDCGRWESWEYSSRRGRDKWEWQILWHEC